VQKSPEEGLSHVRGSRLHIVAATLRTKRPLFEKKRFLAREGAYKHKRCVMCRVVALHTRRSHCQNSPLAVGGGVFYVRGSILCEGVYSM